MLFTTLSAHTTACCLIRFALCNDVLSKVTRVLIENSTSDLCSTY